LLWSDLATNPLDPHAELTRGVLILGIPVLRGLLQGTVLAPSLFNVSINTLPGGLRTNFQAHCFKVGPPAGLHFDINSLLFADDTATLPG
ncbi:hypothetical protein HDU81_000819, partial [Chytriomyces hyalinus]